MHHFFWSREVPLPAYRDRSDRIVFLDRDGTLNEDPGYLSTVENARLLPGTETALKRLVEHDFLPVVLTNQSGIARGYFDLGTLRTIHMHFHRTFKSSNAPVYGWFFCPHLPPDELGPVKNDVSPEGGRVRTEYLKTCACRKPSPGLIDEACEHLGYSIDFTRTWAVGDRSRDLKPIEEKGGRTILLNRDAPETSHADYRVRDLREAVDCIIESCS